MATKTDRNAERSPQSLQGSRAPQAGAPQPSPTELDPVTKLLLSIEPYATQIAIGLAAVFVVVVVSILWSAWEQRTRATAWNAYFSALYARPEAGAPAASDPAADKLAGVAEQFPNSGPAVWSKIMIADGKLDRGGNSFVSRADADRKEGQEFLVEAKKLYSEAYAAAKNLSEAQGALLQQRALFGLALAEESLAGVGDKDAEQYYKDAETHYKELIQGWPLGLYTIRAEKRVKELADARTKKFYADFRAYVPEAPKGPGVPGEKPSMDIELSPPLSSSPASISPPGGDVKLGPLTSPTGEPVVPPATPDATPAAPATPATEAPATPAPEAPATPAAPETPTTEPAKPAEAPAAPATETPAAPAAPETPATPETPAAPATEAPAPAAP